MVTTDWESNPSGCSQWKSWAGWAQPDGRRPSWWVETRSSISPRHTWEFNVTVALCLTQYHWFPAKCHDTSSSDFKSSPKRSDVSIILFVLDKILVGTSSLVAVGWAHHSEVGDETQRWNGLNGLVGGGHPLQPEFFTQSNTHNLSTLPVR